MILRGLLFIHKLNISSVKWFSFIHWLRHSYFESVFFFFFFLQLINFQHRWFRFKCFLWLKRLLLLVVSATNAHSIEFYWQQHHIGLRKKPAKQKQLDLLADFTLAFFLLGQKFNYLNISEYPMAYGPWNSREKLQIPLVVEKVVLKSPQLANKRQDTKKHKVIARNSDMGIKSTNWQSNWFSLVNRRYSFN